jgi:hypothetical protein
MIFKKKNEILLKLLHLKNLNLLFLNQQINIEESTRT